MQRVIKVMWEDAKDAVFGGGVVMATLAAAACVISAAAVPLAYHAGEPIPPMFWVMASIGWVLIVVAGVFFGVMWYSSAEERAERQLAREERRERRKQARREN